jgi:hypothetical protein
MNKKKLEGVGGWLLLFVVIQTIGLILLIPFSVFTFFIYDHIIEVFVSSIDLLVCFFGLYVMYNLIKLKEGADKLAIFYILLDIPLTFLWRYENYILTSNGFEGYYVGGLLGTALWTLYFLKSKRVANTYHKKTVIKNASKGKKRSPNSRQVKENKTTESRFNKDGHLKEGIKNE